jgi:hypothetical protein
MDAFFVMLSLTMIPVAIVYAAYALICLGLPGVTSGVRLLPWTPFVMFGFYWIVSETGAGGVATAAVFLLATMLLLVVSAVIMFRHYGPPMRFLSFSGPVLALLMALYAIGVAEEAFQRDRATSPLRLLHFGAAIPTISSARAPHG